MGYADTNCQSLVIWMFSGCLRSFTKELPIGWWTILLFFTNQMPEHFRLLSEAFLLPPQYRSYTRTRRLSLRPSFPF